MVYEQIFILKYYGGWSFIEAYNLPVKLRGWFVERLAKQIKDESVSEANKRRVRSIKEIIEGTYGCLLLL